MPCMVGAISDRALTIRDISLIPFRLNISAYDVLIASFSFSVGGASCPALEQLNSRRLCNVNLEKWYYYAYHPHYRVRKSLISQMAVIR